MENKPVKVLLIEDSEADARLIREMFSERRRFSFELVWADLLQKGLQYLESETFDVILLDLHLPDSCGVTTIGMVRAKAPHMPIVVLTSFNDEVRAVSAVREGAEDYVVKGQVDGNLLTRSLLHAIEHRRAMVSVQIARDELEIRVKDRTAELTQTIQTLKKTEMTLAAERKRFENVLDMMPAYAILLTPDYHVAFANRTFRETFGDDNGSRCYEFLFNRNEPCETCETYTVLKTGASHYWEWTGPNNRNYDVYDYPFTDADGSPLIMEIGVDVTARKQTEAGLRDSKERLGFLSSRLLSAYEEERKRISREVHDVITSSLGAILLSQKNTINKLHEEDNEATKDAMERAISMTQEVMRESRRIINDLRPPMLDDLGLITTVSWLSRQFATVYPAIALNQQIEVRETDIPEELKIVIFRIAQEAFTNIGKYSQAQTARITLKITENSLELCITDNGIGFNVQDTLAKRDDGRGLGLISMRERAELSGGTLIIESAAGKGTAICASWPANIM